MAENQSQQKKSPLRRDLILKALKRNKGNPLLRAEASKKALLERANETLPAK